MRIEKVDVDIPDLAESRIEMGLSDERRKCPSCGNKFSGYGNICPRCGTPVPHSPVIEEKPANQGKSGRQYPFSDLHSFKDYVVMVRLCAPDNFLTIKGVPPYTLENAFEGLDVGLSLSEKQGADPIVISKCRELMRVAYEHYRANRLREGFFAMEEMSKTIKRLPSQ